MKTSIHTFYHFLRLFRFFLILNSIPLLMTGIDMIITHNYVVGSSAMLLFSAISIVVMGHMRLKGIIRKNPGSEVVKLDSREKWIMWAVRILVAVAAICMHIAVGRCMLGYWIVVSAIVVEVLTLYATELVKIHKTCKIIIKDVI